MLEFVKCIVLCTLAGMLLASVFLTPAGAVAGAAQGFFVGALVGWGNRKAQREKKLSDAAAADPFAGAFKL
jgi:hypothetical protein